ncbi:hypothetical protein B0H67DRAFT_237418 [Lasiosphaeris hirsuta]|uniref:Uncharacterized protein n=1 Tax=Lasiosphaeris hirsuta TaxID=260670 RepID=A0AA40AG83_9PEZI|nr:hypothetical protein B0H67DRAFT_237418 [Lasiosphaeris hirsuta]
MVSLILFTVLVSGVAALSNTTPPPSYPTDQAAIAFGATSPAKRGLLERLAIKLDKRQAVQTCGYIDNDTDLPLTCGYASTCSADLAAGLAGCCQGNQQPCPMATSCIPWVSLALCDGNCIADPGLLKW